MRAIRRGAAWLHLILAVAIVVGVFVQVYLIGGYIFGAGTDALDAHQTVGFTTHSLEVLLFVAALVAWLPRTDLLLSLGLAVLGTVQVTLSESSGWTGGLHALGALFVLVLATVLAHRAMRARRAAPTWPASA